MCSPRTLSISVVSLLLLLLGSLAWGGERGGDRGGEDRRKGTEGQAEKISERTASQDPLRAEDALRDEDPPRAEVPSRVEGPSPDEDATSSGGPTWAERLGYPPGRVVLLLHSDDVGMCYEANLAAKEYLSSGRVRSASMMAPCPWFDEIAVWYREHPDLDLGLHLTLTSEWRHYRWGPVAPRSEVPRLVDPDGHLWRSVLDVATKAGAPEVEREIRAQLEKALSRGIRPGHLDTHMGTLFARADYARAYLRMAEEHGIPALVVEFRPDVLERLRNQGYPITDAMVEMVGEYRLPKLDDLHSVPSGKTYEEKREKLFSLVRSLRPGITQIILHPSIESEALRRITASWQQRVWEARIFADPEVETFFRNAGVLFTDWKEMMRRHAEVEAGEGPCGKGCGVGPPSGLRAASGGTAVPARPCPAAILPLIASRPGG